MTAPADRPPLEEQIAQWRLYLRRRRAIQGPDVEELEGHLRDQLDAVTEAGLAEDEAFLVAVKRMGSSTRCRASSPASTPSGCGSSWSSTPRPSTSRGRPHAPRCSSSSASPSPRRAVGFAYVGGRWFTGERRMDFVRFSGELAIYFVLIALGGGVLTGFTMMMFDSIGIDAEWLYARFLAGRGPFAVLERWQIAYLPVYSVWAAFVVVVFPPVFGYR